MSQNESSGTDIRNSFIHNLLIEYSHYRDLHITIDCSYANIVS